MNQSTNLTIPIGLKLIAYPYLLLGVVETVHCSLLFWYSSALSYRGHLFEFLIFSCLGAIGIGLLRFGMTSWFLARFISITVAGFLWLIILLSVWRIIWYLVHGQAFPRLFHLGIAGIPGLLFWFTWQHRTLGKPHIKHCFLRAARKKSPQPGFQLGTSSLFLLTAIAAVTFLRINTSEQLWQTSIQKSSWQSHDEVRQYSVGVPRTVLGIHRPLKFIVLRSWVGSSTSLKTITTQGRLVGYETANDRLVELDGDYWILEIRDLKATKLKRAVSERDFREWLKSKPAEFT
ncbi:MAG: hypothetical protein AAF497_29365, partial [Planctomycetota bacterium]